MPSYSFIVPIYNDAFMAEEFCKEFEFVMKSFLHNDTINDNVELIFVNDGSNDNSATVLMGICNKYRFVKVINLSRNFGQHIAVSCGYKYSKGDYVGMLNVDMQDPPDQIPILIESMNNNKYDIIYGLREIRQSPFLEKLTSLLFNYLLNKLTGYQTPYNVATIRIMNKKFTEVYNSLTEKSRYLPGLQGWIGFNQGHVLTKHRKRQKGQSSYNFKKRFIMALEAIISFSDIPLKLIAMTGILIALIGFLLMIYLIIIKLFFVEMRPGYTSTFSVIVFFGGVQILVIGLSALYIGRILKEVQNRPLFVVKDTYNFNNEKQN